MNRLLLLIIILSYLLGSCDQSNQESVNMYFSMDSLVNQQINLLLSRKTNLKKSAIINNKSEVIELLPDSVVWVNELDIFRKAEINKAAYVDAFEVISYNDLESGLQVLSFDAKEDAPVRFIRIYYQNEPENIKWIEAEIKEETRVFSQQKKLRMEFRSIGSEIYLSAYSVTGRQKMILSEPTTYRLEGTITYDWL